MSYDTLPETELTSKRFRCGDTREDGKLFWAYQKNCRGGEYWVSQEQFLRLRCSVKDSARKQIIGPEARERHEYTQKKWRERNAEKLRKQGNARAKKRRSEDPVFAMQCRFRNLLSKALRKRRVTKASSSVLVAGISWEEFPEHIEARFLPGMTWDNREEWHIDHIVPLARAKTKQDVIDLSHHLNLRPLWKEDNLIKSDSMPPRELVPEHLLRFCETSAEANST